MLLSERLYQWNKKFTYGEHAQGMLRAQKGEQSLNMSI